MSGVGEFSAAAGGAFGLIALAEIGDKSQLVCMTLAARHRAIPVLAGTVAAFAALNLVAVVFGAALANWVPEKALAVVVAVLFAAFGIHSLRAKPDLDGKSVKEKSGRSVILTAFLLILMSEFGDKTQIAVAGLSSAANPVAVWAGATAALVVTSTMGVLAGRTVLQRMPVVWLHRVSGVIFLGLAAYALSRVFTE